MKKFLILSALFALSAASAQTAPKMDGTIGAKEYANTYKHADSGITVSWQIVGDTVYFGVTSKAKIWTGLGFNPTGKEKDGADMYMFIFDKGKVVAQDMVMTKPKGEPKMDDKEDGKDNILASAGSMNGGTMTVEFSRKLNTGDKADAVLTQGKSVKLLLAVSDNPNVSKAHSKKDRWEAEVVLK